MCGKEGSLESLSTYSTLGDTLPFGMFLKQALDRSKQSWRSITMKTIADVACFRDAWDFGPILYPELYNPLQITGKIGPTWSDVITVRYCAHYICWFQKSFRGRTPRWSNAAKSNLGTHRDAPLD